MTNRQYLAALKGLGFTVHRVIPGKAGVRAGTLILQGPDGQIAMIPDPDGLTVEQRQECLATFKKTWTLA